ncbi:MAG: dihydrofolate reductase family protein [candidate division Zixibacteria bacterium]|nr:dihydrofolate reductase family protein [candidate division Zixibacteria bacterium]
MRKIIASEFYSLDGMMSDPEDKMEWVLGNFNEAMGKYEDYLYDDADTLLLGPVTYKIFESYWPHAADNPATPKGDVEMEHKIKNITKIVFSTSLKTLSWGKSRLFTYFDAKEIVKLKEAPGKNILVIGSASIVQQLTNLGLIDEYHFVLFPVILGQGKALFANTGTSHNLELMTMREFGNGGLLLTYHRK